jgi:long-chain acyl-CoA synthetase
MFAAPSKGTWMLEDRNDFTDGGSGFYAFAARHPDRPAIVGPDGSEVSFGALLGRVNSLSHAFLAHRLTAGDAIAGVLHNGSDYFAALLAAGQLGMYFVPVNWRLTPDEVTYILRDSGAKLVVADAEHAAALPTELMPAHRFAVHGTPPGWEPFEQLGAKDCTSSPTARRAGGLMGYTSGTTGHPKGVKVALPPMSPEEYAATMLSGLTSYGVEFGAGAHLVCSPVYHAAPGSHAWFFLHAGHTLVIHSKFDPEATLRDIEKYRVTTSHMVPTHFIRMLRLPPDVRTHYDLSSLQAVIHAGAPCPVPVKRRMIDWLGPIVWEYLGSTEGLVSRVSPQEWLARPGTLGRPAPGKIVKILDDDGKDLPAGNTGAIYVGAEGRPPTFEYLGDPGKTAENREGNLFTVGDIGYLDADGYLFLQDRRTDLIISGGVNIYPAEIESYLVEHPAVADVAVIGIPDPEWGHTVVAVVEPVDGVTPGDALAQELKRFCEDGLARFKHPRRIDFVDQLPRTAAGKLQRRVVREAYLDGLPEPSGSPTEN